MALQPELSARRMTCCCTRRASAGEKSGAVAFDNSGRSANVEPEKTRNYEFGIKSQLLNRRVTLNANLYYTKVRDYQNVTSEADPTSPTGFSSRLGNVPGVRARGVEFDTAVRVTEHLEITGGGAFNDAIYTDWHTATCPRSFPTTVAFCDNTGKQIVGAPRWTGILGFNYEQPFASGYSGICSATSRTARSTTSSSCCRSMASRRRIRSPTSVRASRMERKMRCTS